MAHHAVILGCGYTGKLVAQQLLKQGWRVSATTRTPENLATLERLGAEVVQFDIQRSNTLPISCKDASILISVPTLRNGASGESLLEPTPELITLLGNDVRQIVYFSTTGVYGSTKLVDETTSAAPETLRQHLRMRAEQAVQAHVVPTLILRPAAIYGPNRGVHAAMRAGRFRLLANSRNFISRIHVQDLAAVTVAAMNVCLAGIFPVADKLPTTSQDVASYCAKLLGIAMPAAIPANKLSETRQSNRQVDGTAVLRMLGTGLQYPNYRVGIAACIKEESDLQINRFQPCSC